MLTLALMKYALCLANLLVGASAFANFDDMPNVFEMQQRFFTMGTDFQVRDINDKSHVYGTVVQKLLHWTKTFELRDSAGALVGSAREKFLTWVATADVFDGAGNKIGTVKEQFWNSLFKVMTTYSILDASGNVIATSEKFDFFATDFTLKDPSGAVVATMERPFLNHILTDKWTVHIAKAGVIDNRLIVFTPAFKTAADSEHSSSSSSSSKSKRK